MNNFVTSTQGIDFIKRHEGLVLHAYNDGYGTWTIGYGHTSGVYSGMTITESEAETYLIQDLGSAEYAVNNYVQVNIPQYRFDALVSLVFNVGATAFYNSRLRQKLNQGNIEGAANEFDDWIYANGSPSPGLINRRADEKNLFLTGSYTSTTSGGNGNGNSSSTITNIQTTLNQRYNTGLNVDGVFGSNTKRAMIKGLQTELNQLGANLAVDGWWGPLTKAACPIIYPVSSGYIQYIIKAALYCIGGFTSLAVNGNYDTSTSEVVKVFQRNRNLSSVDGRTGPETFEALFG